MSNPATVLPIQSNFIAGSFRQSQIVGETIAPATGEVIGQYYEASVQDVHDAIESAYDTFKHSDWKFNRELRAKALNELADRFEARQEELITLISKENGKLLGEAAFEFSLTPSKLRYYAALALTESGQSAQVRKGVYSTLVSEPIGVAGIIVPWNAPLVLAVRSFAPALAAGCTCVIKMPAQTALVNGLISEIIASVESLPSGVIHLFTEAGDTGAKLLVEAKKVAAISYTGSTAVGQKIAQAGATQLKRLSLELGGKTPMIIFNDAQLEKAIPTLIGGVTTFTGQFCMTGSRILVQKDIAETVKKQLIDALSNVQVGAGDDPQAQMGPMIDAANAKRIDDIVANVGADVEVLVRGGRGRKAGEEVSEQDAFYRPSLLAVQDVNSPLIQEELFGPVATFEVFEDEADLVERANATKYGLGASVWTTNRERSLTLPEQLEVGTVWINGWALVLDQFEEGGFKQSGLGRLNGQSALSEFQELKHIVQVQ